VEKDVTKKNFRTMQSNGRRPVVLFVLVGSLAFARAGSPDKGPNLPPRLKDTSNTVGMAQTPDKDVQASNPGPSGSAANISLHGQTPASCPPPVNGLGEFAVLARERNSHTAAGQSPQPSRSSTSAITEHSSPPSQLPWVISLILLLVSGMGLLFHKMETDR
jgi:hypothetical protein